MRPLAAFSTAAASVTQVELAFSSFFSCVLLLCGGLFLLKLFQFRSFRLLLNLFLWGIGRFLMDDLLKFSDQVQGKGSHRT